MAQHFNTCEPAYTVIERLGGRPAVAKALGLSTAALCRWCCPRPRGTAGNIPVRHWSAILKLAEKKGVRLTLKMLLGM